MFYFGCDIFPVAHSIFSFFSSLFLPVVLIVVLASLMGGNGAGLAEALGDALASCLALVFDLGLRLAKTLVVAAVTILSAVVRVLLAWSQNQRVKLRTGDHTEEYPPAEKSD